MHVIMGKIMNPTSVQRDINFQLKISTMDPSTHEESPLYFHESRMFINMLTGTPSGQTEADSHSSMFEPGAKVGDYGKYIIHKPETSGSFAKGDWFIAEMDTQFTYSGVVNGCLAAFYQYCIVFPEVNWLAIKI